MKKIQIIAWGLGGAIVLLFGVISFLYYQASASLTDTKLALSEATSTIETLEKDKQDLEEALVNEQNRVNAFEEELESFATTIGRLDKLSRLDPELLKKYSKVYFLSENYSPSDLGDIDEQWSTNPDKELQFLKEALPFLEDLLEDAEDDGISLKILSSYRSFGTQAQLKSNYVVRYGSGANTFSAEQGYSEHQLGTTVDFVSEESGWQLSGFGDTEAFTWLTSNAHRYGFVLSYPEGNTYYEYEPWHWRFVGQDLAGELHDRDQYFYDLDQRYIDEFLIGIFE